MRDVPTIARIDQFDRVSKAPTAEGNQTVKETILNDVAVMDQIGESNGNRYHGESHSSLSSLSTIGVRSSTPTLARAIVKNLERSLHLSDKPSRFLANSVPDSIGLGLASTEDLSSEVGRDSDAGSVYSNTNSASSSFVSDGPGGLQGVNVSSSTKLSEHVPSLIQNGQILKISPNELIHQLKSSRLPNSAEIPPLCVDLRPHGEFQANYISNSINLSLLPLHLKRFRRLGVANFNVGSFLSSEVSKKAYEDWLQTCLSYPTKSRCVVIYDSNISQANCETDTWAFIVNSAEALSHEFVKGTYDSGTQSQPSVVFAFLDGGFHAFKGLEGASAFIIPENSTISSSPSVVSDIAFSDSAVSNSDLTSWPSGSRTRLAGLKITPQDPSSPSQATGTIGPLIIPPPRKGSKFGLSINTANRVRSSSKGKLSAVMLNSPVNSTHSMKLLQTDRSMSKMKSTESIPSASNESSKEDSRHESSMSLESQESPLTSPNDNAQPPDPFSKVNENILIGSDVIPHAPDAIERFKEIGVTHILNMAAEVPNQDIVQNCPGLTLKWLPVMDNTEQDMDGPLKEAIDFIEGAISSNPNNVVFVHCKAGRSRSVSVVIGYLIVGRKYTLKNAYDHVRSCRKGVSPNLGFMAALLKVEKETHGVNSTIP